MEALVGAASHVLGRRLLVDPMSETVVDRAQANALLTRHYCRSFVMTEDV